MDKELFELPKSRKYLPLVRDISVVILFWCASIYLVAHSTPAQLVDFGGLATLLFGAASIALFLLSIAIGASAFFGWQTVIRLIRDAAKSAVNKNLEVLENEIRGRVNSGLGYLVGEMGLDPISLKVRDEDKLEEAVVSCRAGYEFLRKVGGPAEIMGLNNLIYYSCAGGKEANRDFVLSQAKRLKEEAQNHSGPGASNVLLTACRAILKYSINTAEQNEARATLSILLKASLPARQRREAELYLKLFPEAEEQVPSLPKKPST